MDQGTKAVLLRRATDQLIQCALITMLSIVYVCIMQSFLDQGTKAGILRRAADQLIQCGIVRSRANIQYILHARVPLLKFQDARYGEHPCHFSSTVHLALSQII